MTTAPIILFVYNRPYHTERVLESIEQNFLSYKSDLIVFSDGPKNMEDHDEMNKINAVRKIIRSKNWCRTVQLICAEKNVGAEKSQRYGVQEIIKKHQNIIVIQDDTVLGNNFLLYMNTALNIYRENEEIKFISGYSFGMKKSNVHETFFLNICSAWGWGTWANRWTGDVFKDQLYNNHELSTIIDAELFNSLFVNDGLTLYPKHSFIKNIGFDNSGAYFKLENRFNVDFYPTKLNSFPKIAIKEKATLKRSFKHFLRSANEHHQLNFFKYILSRISCWF